MPQIQTSRLRRFDHRLGDQTSRHHPRSRNSVYGDDPQRGSSVQKQKGRLTVTHDGSDHLAFDLRDEMIPIRDRISPFNEGCIQKIEWTFFPLRKYEIPGGRSGRMDQRNARSDVPGVCGSNLNFRFQRQPLLTKLIVESAFRKSG